MRYQVKLGSPIELDVVVEVGDAPTPIKRWKKKYKAIRNRMKQHKSAA